MAFYYVKSGGTAVGDAGRSVTARTGSFADMGASAYYNSVYDVFAGLVPTTSPDGDVVIVSNLHEEIHTTITLGVNSVTSYLPPNIISMLDTDISIYSKGAAVTCSSGSMNIGSAVNFKSGYLFKGFVFNTQFGSFSSTNSYSKCVFDDCDINGTSVTTLYISKCELIDCITACKLISGTLNKIVGGSLIVTWAYIYSNSGFGSIRNVDLSGSIGGSRIYYGCKGVISSCKLNHYPPVKATAYRPTDSVEYFGCDIAGKYYNYAGLFFAGEVITVDNIYLNYKYDGASLSSLAFNSNSNALKGNPLKVKLCEIPAQDLSVVDTTYRVNLLLDTATAASLTDSEFWIELSHNDNTSLALGKIVSSRNTDILAAGTELTASSEVWQGTLPATSQAYQVDIILSAASLPNVTNGNVVIYANLAVPNVSVYVDPAVQIGV